MAILRIILFTFPGLFFSLRGMSQDALELRLTEVQIDSATGLHRGSDIRLELAYGRWSDDVQLFMSDSLQVTARFRLRNVKSTDPTTNGSASRFHIRYLCKQNGKTERILMTRNFAGDAGQTVVENQKFFFTKAANRTKVIVSYKVDILPTSP
jgi:hypothetical protein